ncbi:54S ribosomal protein img2, mitochondrial [Rhodotorula kratochvilovae]
MQRSLLSATLRPTLRTRTAPAVVPAVFAWPLRSYSAAPSATTSAAPSDATAALSQGATLRYNVPRTRFGELPVYSEFKNGGSRVLTVVRKAEGDVEALRTDLAAFLSSVPSLSKPAQGQVVLRGDWVREVKEWLGAKGF